MYNDIFNRVIVMELPEMLMKLNELYDKEQQLKDNVSKQYLILKQCQDDIEAAEMMIMHKSNKLHREQKVFKC